MTVRIPVQRLRSFATEALQCAGLTEQDAAAGAEVVVYADVHGFTTHGSNALAGIYVPRLRDGRINPGPQLRTVSDTASGAVLDGDRGLGLVSTVRATDLAIGKARQTGIALVAVRNSSHFGSAGYYAHRATEAGLIAIAMTNCGAQGVAPGLGGTTRMLGTNPLAAGAPAPGGAPFVLDMSATTVATGKIRAAQREGREVPVGWLTGLDGMPVTDPNAYFDGKADVTWLGGSAATGGAKGYGLAILVDLLCGPLAGASWGPTPDLLENGEERPDTDIGHVVIAIDPAAFGAGSTFGAGARQLLDTLSADLPVDPARPVTYPGAPEARTAAASLADGVALPDHVARQLLSMAADLEIKAPTELAAVAE
ncbi:Ldh family oxidoreductase [Kitasatospora sp. NPDC006697]|uniref:Ldh family oxidoreductase n=1 Tax=Kitasatospora sp. NPDC006697 TaxID=3364020 RepID=UPI0036914640